MAPKLKAEDSPNSEEEERIVAKTVDPDDEDALDCYKREKEARILLEKERDSLREELQRVRDYNFNLQQFNINILNDLKSATDSNLQRERQKSEILETSAKDSFDQAFGQRAERQVQELTCELVRFKENMMRCTVAEADKLSTLEETCSSQRDQISVLQHQLAAANHKLEAFSVLNVDILMLLKFYFHEDFRKTAVSAVPDLLRFSKLAIEAQGCDGTYLKKLSDYIVPAFVEALHKEPDTKIIATMLDALSKCLQIFGPLLDENQVRSIVDEMKQMIAASSSREEVRAERTNAEDFDAELLKEEDRMSSMETVFNCVIPYILNGDDRNSVSLVCRKCYEIDCLTRKHVTVHVRYAPTPSRLSKRFPFLESLTLKGMKNSDTSIDLSPWIREIAIKFTHLKSLCIRRLVIGDSDLKHLAENRGKDLRSLKICECEGFSESGLMCVAKYCSELREVCLEGIDLVGDKEVEEHGKWLRVLALRKIEKFSHRYDAVTTLFGQEDVVFLLEKCRESLVSLRVDTCSIDYAAQAISNAVNLQDFYGAFFDEDEQYIGFKLPSSIRSLGLSDMPRGSIRFVDHLLNQLRELDFRWIDVPGDCQCLFLQGCPNLEVLYTEDVCKDTGLELISQVCKKLRKLTAYSGTHLGLMAVAQGCPNLEYLHVKLADISNEALECIGSNLKNLRVFHIRVRPEEDEECNTIIPLDNGIRAMLIGCTKLERLSIHLYDEEDLTDVGLGFIGKYGINLRFLSLAYIGGSDEGLRALSIGCPRLRKLEIQGSDFSEQAIGSFLFKVRSLRYIYILDDRCEVVSVVTRPNIGSSTMEAQDCHQREKEARTVLEIERDLLKEELQMVRAYNSSLQQNYKVQTEILERLCSGIAFKQREDAVERQVQELARFKETMMRSTVRVDEADKLRTLEETCSSQRDQISVLQRELAAANQKLKVPTQLESYVKLAVKLDRLALQLVAGGGSGLKSVKVTYPSTTEPDLLRSMVAKGIHISEEQVILDGPLKTSYEIIQVKVANVESQFVGAISESGDLKVEGTLKYGVPYLTKVGAFEVDVSLEGDIILCRQVDQPGIIGSVLTILGEEKVNVSFVSVGKTIRIEAVMAIVVDKKPRLKTLKKIGESWGVNEVVFLAL